jgi:hypothetical protein
MSTGISLSRPGGDLEDEHPALGRDHRTLLGDQPGVAVPGVAATGLRRLELTEFCVTDIAQWLEARNVLERHRSQLQHLSLVDVAGELRTGWP